MGGLLALERSFHRITEHDPAVFFLGVHIIDELWGWGGWKPNMIETTRSFLLHNVLASGAYWGEGMPMQHKPCALFSCAVVDGKVLPLSKDAWFLQDGTFFAVTTIQGGGAPRHDWCGVPIIEQVARWLRDDAPPHAGLRYAFTFLALEGRMFSFRFGGEEVTYRLLLTSSPAAARLWVERHLYTMWSTHASPTFCYEHIRDIMGQDGVKGRTMATPPTMGEQRGGVLLFHTPLSAVPAFPLLRHQKTKLFPTWEMVAANEGPFEWVTMPTKMERVLTLLFLLRTEEENVFARGAVPQESLQVPLPARCA